MSSYGADMKKVYDDLIIIDLLQNCRNFMYCRPVQNQYKYHILFHKNSSPHDLYKMTLGF